jgi:hypothetical protein
VVDSLLWSRSTVTRFTLSELVNGGQLAPNVDGQPPAWIVPPAADQEPNPPFGYVVSFIRHHDHGFTAPASRFMRGLCYHYGVELQNFALNAILQAATFVGVGEGFLGIPAYWDLWVHLFLAELHTLSTPEPRVRRAVHAGGMSISLRESRRELYIPCTMTSNNAEWEQGWFYLRNDEPGLPLHRQGPEGEGRLLVARAVLVFVPGPAGVSPACAEELGRRRAGCGLGSHEPSPPADHPPHGEEAPHL